MSPEKVTGRRMFSLILLCRSTGRIHRTAAGRKMAYYCEVHTRTAQKKVRISFTELSRILAAYPPFAVIGRGVVVNFDYTSHISGCDCVMSNGDKVPVSRRKIKETEQAFLDRQFSRMLAEGN